MNYPDSRKEEQKLNEVLNQMAQAQLIYRQEITEYFKQLMENLTTEQRKKLIRILKQKNIFLRLMRQKSKLKNNNQK
jgi:Spy/CpxP family protein refolding chaperone